MLQEIEAGDPSKGKTFTEKANTAKKYLHGIDKTAPQLARSFVNAEHYILNNWTPLPKYIFLAVPSIWTIMLNLNLVVF